MTFQDVLAQAIDWLRREQRLSYRALKRQFDLDDAYLDDLKYELVEIQRIAIDQDGKMLVWTGGPEGIPVSASQPAQITQQPTAWEKPSKKVAPPPADMRPLGAERRQLTVMFCDLVNSTKLSSQLDLEDYREVVRAYQVTCTEVIHQFDGYIAQYLGDGLLVYFGYPQAHEDDAQRAVRTGLGIVEVIRTLNTCLEPAKGIRLAVRISIHTGLVVIGDVGAGAKHEQLALGAVPNVASRIQGLAEPDTVVMSEATFRLVQGYFDCQELGEQTLRGVAEPLTVYRVLRESGVQSRLDVASTRGLTPLVGRESEVTILLERWEQAKNGHGQVILLSGEAGIGKSRLVQVLKDDVAEQAHIRLEGRSSPYYQNTPLYPITDLIQRTLQWQSNDTPERKLEKLEQTLRQYRLPLEESVPMFAPLLSLSIPEERYPPLALSPQRQRQKTLESIIAILLESAEHHPVLFILEDLHWTDPTTLELLDLLIDQTPAASLCALLTYRPTFQSSWSHRTYLTEMILNRLSRSQSERMVERITDGKRLPSEVMQQVVERTDGVPLYIEEITKALLESGHLKEIYGRYELTGTLPTLTIPTTLQDSLMARLDRLVPAKAVAQYASVIGRQFSYALLQGVLLLDEPTLQRELNRLVEAELLYQRGLPPQATYTFKHALIQDAAYQSLLKSTRQQYHLRIAQALADQFPETAEHQPELLAQHYTEAGLYEQAIGYWQRAGQRAIQRSTNVEATGHLTKGLELLATLPDAPEHLQQELDMQMSLGAALMATQGPAAPGVKRSYARALELCEQVGETPQLFPALWGLWRFYFSRGEFQTAQERGEQLLTVAQHQHDSTRLLAAHSALGATLSWIGAFASARVHLEQGIALFSPAQDRALAGRYGMLPGLQCHYFITGVLWWLGYPAQALWQTHQARALAQELSHPPSLALALYYTARLHLLRRDVPATLEQAEATIALATEQGFTTYTAMAMFLRGWALAAQGQGEEGVAQMWQALTDALATGASIVRPMCLTLLAEAYGREGQVDQGLRILAEGLAVSDQGGARYYEAEGYRLKGELLLQQDVPDTAQAETCFHYALAIAYRQQAKSWELRAAMSLAHLWQRQGKRKAAYNLLAPVYGWFTEGFDTADLQEAKALLEQLGA